MKIVKATKKELAEIKKLNNKYFFEVRNFKKIISGNNNYFFIGKIGKKIVGFSGLEVHKWNNTARIINIFIHPDYRRKGLATQFIRFLKEKAKKIGVRAIIAEAPSLNSAKTLYLKNNFRICGYNDRYYSNIGKEKAIFLSFDLK